MKTPLVLERRPTKSIDAISDKNLYRRIGDIFHSTGIDDDPGFLLRHGRGFRGLNNEAAETTELRTLASVAVNNRLISLDDRLDLVDEVQDRSSSLLLNGGTNPMLRPVLRALQDETLVKIDLLEGVWPGEEWCARRQDSLIGDIRTLTGRSAGEELKTGKGILSELIIHSMYMHLFLGGRHELPVRANLRQDMGKNGAYDIALLTSEAAEVNAPATKVQVKASRGYSNRYNDDIVVLHPGDLGVTNKRGIPMGVIALASSFMHWDLSGFNDSCVVSTASSNLLLAEATAAGVDNVAKIQPISVDA